MKKDESEKKTTEEKKNKNYKQEGGQIKFDESDNSLNEYKIPRKKIS